MKAYEKKLLRHLDWDLNLITPSYYRGIVLEEAGERDYTEHEIYGHNDTIGKPNFLTLFP